MRPRPRLKLVLAAETELLVRHRVSEVFKDAQHADPGSRTEVTYELELHAPGAQWVWGIAQDGSVGSACSAPHADGPADRPLPPPISLMYMIAFLVRTQHAAAFLMEDFEHHGRVELVDQVQLGKELLSGKTIDNRGLIPGIGELNEKFRMVDAQAFSIMLDSSELREPWIAAAYLLNRSLRSLREADIHLSRLQNFIKSITPKILSL